MIRFTPSNPFFWLVLCTPFSGNRWNLCRDCLLSQEDKDASVDWCGLEGSPAAAWNPGILWFFGQQSSCGRLILMEKTGFEVQFLEDTPIFPWILPGWWTQDPKILLVDCDFQNGCNMMQLTKWQRLSDLTFEEPFLKGVLNSRPLTAWCQNSQPLTWNTFCGGCPKEE